MSNCTNSLLHDLNSRQDIYTHYENSDEKLTWCSGCGNYGIQKALIRALTLEGYGHRDSLLCYDIGCNGNGSDKIGAYTIHGLHGRVIPLAAGAAIANTDIQVVAMAGDGATFSEGVNHLVHAVRNDYPFPFICHNNENYGLTTGQASAATRRGERMNASPDGVFVEPINACQFVLSLHPTFVARTFSGDVKHMTKTLQSALRHPGFAFVEVMQTCPTYNRHTSQDWFWERIRDVEEIKNYDRHDIWQARKIADDFENEIAVGVLYEREEQDFMHRLVSREGKNTPLTQEVRHYGVDELLQEFS